jgi:hypothetical protein
MLVDYIPANILFKIIIESSFYRKIFHPIITSFPTVLEWIWRAKGEIVKKMKQESTERMDAAAQQQVRRWCVKKIMEQSIKKR